MAFQNDFNNLIVRTIWPPKMEIVKIVKISKCISVEKLEYVIYKSQWKYIIRCNVGVQTITEIKCNDP